MATEIRAGEPVTLVLQPGQTAYFLLDLPLRMPGVLRLRLERQTRDAEP